MHKFYVFILIVISTHILIKKNLIVFFTCDALASFLSSHRFCFIEFFFPLSDLKMVAATKTQRVSFVK